MSIDALVQKVEVDEDGGGRLILVDRPARPGGVPGIAGQPVLFFHKSPAGVYRLEGKLVWGGDSELLLGDRPIAVRRGVARVMFFAQDVFERALRLYSDAKP
jgi:hypothetical protein